MRPLKSDRTLKANEVTTPIVIAAVGPRESPLDHGRTDTPPVRARVRSYVLGGLIETFELAECMHGAGNSHACILLTAFRRRIYSHTDT